MITNRKFLMGCKLGAMTTAAALALVLSGASGQNVAPPAIPPPGDTLKGLTLFSAHPGKPIRADQLDLSRSGNKLDPIRLVAPRNGVASGQVVIADTKALTGVTATMSDLTGAGTIPAAQVKIRYAAQKDAQEMQVLRYEVWQKPLGYLSDLQETPPAAPIIPVWITVSVPATAAPGDYKGTLTVKVAGRSQAVPVLLQVANWTVPPPAQWRTHVGISQSPDGVALHYEVPYGSPEHLRLIEESYKYLGAIGCKLAWFSMVDSERGPARHQGMPTYTKSAKGWVPDMTLVEKYLDLHQKYCGTPEVLLVWVAAGNQKMIRFKDASGKVQEIPQETPEAEQFYKTMMDAVHASVVKRGWPESLIILGGACEVHPDEPVVTMLKKLAPYARWSHQAHDPKLEIHGVEVGYCCFARRNPDNWKGLPWKNPRMIVNSSYKSPSTFGHPMYWRWRAEVKMYKSGTSARGFTRIGADFWTYKDKTSKKASDAIGRVEHWTGGQPTIFLSQSLPCLLAPGPKGAISTVQYEMMREGLQELEARIAIEVAIDNKTAPASVVAQWDRTDKANPSLKDRVPSNKGLGAGSSPLDWPNFDQPNWQDKVLELYRLAGELK
jgi:hypothetical protein